MVSSKYHWKEKGDYYGNRLSIGRNCLFTLHVFVGYFGGIKKSSGLLKLVKMKLSKNMSDDTAAIISLVAAGVMLAAGILLFIFGVIQGTA